MKKFITKSRVGVIFTLVLGYFVVYFATSNVDIYLPTVGEAQNNRIIVLDAGHGGMDGGGVSITGSLEKNINLDILLKSRDMLKAFGYDVVTTRESDISIHDDGVEGVGNQKRSDMDNRLELFNKYENSVAVSIHQNQFTEEKYYGAQMFYSNTNPLNEHFAQIMQNKFVQNLQPENNREIKLAGKELFLTYFTENPSLMVECGFLSNNEEAKLLDTSEYRSKVAFTIFSGINEFCESSN